MKSPLLALALLVGLAALAAAFLQGGAPQRREFVTLRESASIPPELLARLDELAERQRVLGVQVSMLEGVAVVLGGKRTSQASMC